MDHMIKPNNYYYPALAILNLIFLLYLYIYFMLYAPAYYNTVYNVTCVVCSESCLVTIKFSGRQTRGMRPGPP